MKSELKHSVDAAYVHWEHEDMDSFYANPIGGYFSRLRVKKVLDAIKKSDSVVLDVGCEAGYVSAKLRKKVKNVVSFDIVFPALQKFRKKMNGISNMFPFQAMSQFIPLKDNSVDYAVLTEVIEHMPEVDKVFSEVARVLKPGGKAIITYPQENMRQRIYWIAKMLGVKVDKEDEVTLFAYSRKDIANLLKRDFKINTFYSFPFWYPITNFIIVTKPMN